MTAFEPYLARVELVVTVTRYEGEWLVVTSQDVTSPFRVRSSLVERVESVADRDRRERFADAEWWDRKTDI